MEGEKTLLVPEHPLDDLYEVLAEELDDVAALRLPRRPETVPADAELVLTGPEQRTSRTGNGREWTLVANGLFWGKPSSRSPGTVILWTTQGKLVPGDWPEDAALPVLVRG